MLEGFYETGVTADGLQELIEGATVGKNQSCISHNEECTIISPIVWGPCEAMQD